MRNLSVILTIVFSILLILVVWIAIIMQTEKKISLNDLFNQREVSLKDLQSVTVRSTNETQPVIQAEATESSQVTGVEDAKETDNFYIIVGSFKESVAAQDKTEKLKSTLQGEFILLPPSKEGYIRISYGKYSTREEAEATIDRVRQSIDRGAWIYSAIN